MGKNKDTEKFGNKVETFRADVQKAQNDGYVCLPVSEWFGEKAKSAGPEWKDVVNTMMYEMGKSSNASRSGAEYYASVGNEIPIEDKGTHGLGWMEWGNGNKLPNLIALQTSLLPYTAAGVKFNTDTAAGLGPVPKYRFSVFENGTVTTKEIDFQDAGLLIEGHIAELKNKLRDHYLYKRVVEKELGNCSAEEIEANKEIEKNLKGQIKRKEEEYEIWQRTKKEVQEFQKENNLELTSLQLFNDMCHLGICFPEIILSKETKNLTPESWNPKAIGLTYRSSLTCRLERMDKENKINHVYISNRWIDSGLQSTVDSNEIVAFPALDPSHPLSSLKRIVRKARENKVAVSKRPTRVIFPSYYPTLGRPYYPQPSWWSIFGGKIYAYASTIIADRAVAKENSNMWGKIIYIHTEYLNKLYLQYSNITDEKKAEIRNQIWTEINEFLKNRSNNGKTLMSFTFIGPDGKEHDAYRIVDVPQSDKDTAAANKTELEEVGSIIFFALEIHPNLIGAVPGRSGSSGGTYQREMYEIKKLNMAPTQNIVLKAMEVVSGMNDWDEHLVWRIKQMTLTTLDRNANGLEETKR